MLLPSLPPPDIRLIDELTRSSLEAFRDSCFNWLLVCAGIVALGVLLEAPEVAHETASAWQRRRWRCIPAGHKPDWVTLLSLIGWLLVGTGVTAEVIADRFVSRADGFVQQFDEILLTDAVRKAGDAKDSAEDAEAAATRASGAADDAELVSRRASDASSTAKTASSAALLSAGTTKEKADTIAAEAEQLRHEVEELSPRILTLGQQLLIKHACTEFHGHFVRVVSYATDVEASQLGGQIVAVLRAAHINVADARASETVIGGFDVGIHIRGPDQEGEFISRLADALSTIGNLEVVTNDPPPKAAGGFSGGGQNFKPGIVFVTVTIGAKPVPVLPIE